MSNPAVETLLRTERNTPFTPPAIALAQAKEPVMNAVTPKAPANAFAIRNLSVLAYAQGFTLWHYRAGAQRLSDTTVPGFFDAATDMFAVGDMMMISAIDGGTMVCIATTGQRVAVAAMGGAPAQMAAE